MILTLLGYFIIGVAIIGVIFIVQKMLMKYVAAEGLSDKEIEHRADVLTILAAVGTIFLAISMLAWGISCIAWVVHLAV